MVGGTCSGKLCLGEVKHLTMSRVVIGHAHALPNQGEEEKNSCD